MNTLVTTLSRAFAVVIKSNKNLITFFLVFSLVVIAACSGDSDPVIGNPDNPEVVNPVDSIDNEVVDPDSIDIEEPKAIQIISDFDHGSIDSMVQVSDSLFIGDPLHWMKSDGIGDQYYWFYFQVLNAKSQTITFKMNDLIGIYRGNPLDQYTDYTFPVLSYDNENWVRVEDVTYDNLTFTFTVNFETDTAWVAYMQPYSYGKSVTYLESIIDNPYVSIIDTGYSTEGRPLNLLQITNTEVPAKDKKKVLIIALQHPGEDCGAYMAEGMIDYLISDTPGAAAIRDKFIYYVVPMMNPDGVYHGCTRYTHTMEDLNVEWDDDTIDLEDAPVEPEALFVKEWVKEFYNADGKLDLFIDIHSQSQKWTGNAFWDYSRKLQLLVESVNEFWTLTHFNSSGGETAGGFIRSRYGIPSATLELTGSYTGDHYYLSTDDYHYYGETMVWSISSYFYGGQ